MGEAEIERRTSFSTLQADRQPLDSTTCRVLLVAELATEARQIEKEIRKVLEAVSFQQVNTPQKFLAALETFSPTLIISEDRLSVFDAMTALKLARQHIPGVPLIVLGRPVDPETADESVTFVQAGAWDYVNKAYILGLGAAVLNVLGRQKERAAHQETITALKESQERARMIVENTSSLVGVLDQEGVYEYASPSHEFLLGFAVEELLGKSAFDFIHPEERSRFVTLWTEALAGKVSKVAGLRFKALARNGGIHYLQASFNVIRDAGGSVENIIYIGDDITPSKEAEDALQREKDRFRALVEESPLGVSLVDKDGRFIYISPKFQKMFGYTLEDIPTGRDWFRKAYPDPDYRHEVMATWLEDIRKTEKGEAPPRKYRVTCKDGSERIVLFFFVIMETGEQLAICQDMTEQDALEIRFMHSQKMESIGRLASGVAHDFNNLLTSILGNADFALMDFADDDPRYEIVQEIRIAAEKAAVLTRQLLTFSRRHKSRPEPVDLNSKIRETEKMLRRLIGEDVELEILLAPEVGQLRIDPGQLEQIIMNLAVNARDAMPAGGRFTIETAAVKLDEKYGISPVELSPGAYVMMSVSDTGVGMSREIRQKIFDPFFTTKEQEKGTGLGLSTVYGIVQQNGGDIHVYSRPGRGTTFKIYFPMMGGEDDFRKKQTEVDKRPILAGNETILVVEDEEKVRNVICMMLRKYGYNVLVAGSGHEAQKIYQEHGRSIKLLLTDMVMPDMDGLEVVRQFKSRQPDVKVICMSGYTDKIIHKEMQEGMVFLHKPFSPEDLAREVKSLLDK